MIKKLKNMYLNIIIIGLLNTIGLLDTTTVSSSTVMTPPHFSENRSFVFHMDRP